MKKTEGVHGLAQIWQGVSCLFRNVPNLVRALLFAMAAILVACSIWRIASSRRVLFPDASFAAPNAYADSDLSAHHYGKSVVLGLKRDPGSIEFRWRLHEGFSDPYAGIHFPARDKKTVLDIRGYDRIVLDISSTENTDFQVVMRFYQRGITDWGNPDTYRPWISAVELNRGRQILRMPLSRFETPSWWFAEHQIREKDCGPIDLQRMLDFEVETGEKSAMGLDCTWQIRGASLERDVLHWWLILTIAVPALCLLAWWLPKLFRKPLPMLAIPYEKLDLGSYQSEELARIVATISSGFHENGLSLGVVADRSRVPQSKITELIQLHFQMSFKEYLNTIRLDEAKRLLIETDRYVNDIAYAVGYNSVPHFNRIFKARFGHSPNELRKWSASKDGLPSE